MNYLLKAECSNMDNPFTWQHLKYCLLLIIIYILISKIIELWQ